MTARTSSSAFPWIITSIVGLGLVGFVVWWLLETRSALEPTTSRPAQQSVPTQQPEEVTQVETTDETTADGTGVGDDEKLRIPLAMLRKTDQNPRGQS